MKAETYENVLSQARKYAVESFPPNPYGKGADKLVLDSVSNNLDISLIK